MSLREGPEGETRREVIQSGIGSVLTLRKVIQASVASAATLATAGVIGEIGLHAQIADAGAIATRRFQASSDELFSGREWTAESIRIASLADFHLAPYNVDAIRKALELVSQANPDAVFIPGDLAEESFYDQFLPLLDEIKTDLRSLTSNFLTIFSPGNHDYDNNNDNLTNGFRTSLERIGINFLHNDLAGFSIAGQQFNVLATGSRLLADVDNIEAIIERSINQFGEQLPTICLSHEPSAAMEIANRAHSHDVPINGSTLFLSGHTHGAPQIVLAGHRLMEWLRIASRSLTLDDVTYNSGMRRMGNHGANNHILTTNGVGVHERDRKDLDLIVLGKNKRIAQATVDILDIAA